MEPGRPARWPGPPVSNTIVGGALGNQLGAWALAPSRLSRGDTC